MAHLIALGCFILAALSCGLNGAFGDIFFALLAIGVEAVGSYLIFMRKEKQEGEDL